MSRFKFWIPGVSWLKVWLVPCRRDCASSWQFGSERSRWYIARHHEYSEPFLLFIFFVFFWILCQWKRMISEFSTKKREWYHLALLHLLLFWSHCLHKSSLYGRSSRLSSPPPLCKYLASTSRTYRWSRAVFLLCAAALLAHSRRIPFRAVTYLPIPIPFFFILWVLFQYVTTT